MNSDYKYREGESKIIRYIEYTDEFKNKVIDFWIKICVEEYGFKNWEKNIRNMNNNTYKNNGGNFWLAVDDEKIVGTISIENIGNNIGILKGMYIDKEYRGRKIASNLLNILLNFAKEKKYKKIVLDTYKEFEIAIKYYEKIGFIRKKQIGERYIYEKEI